MSLGGAHGSASTDQSQSTGLVTFPPLESLPIAMMFGPPAASTFPGPATPALTVQDIRAEAESQQVVMRRVVLVGTPRIAGVTLMSQGQVEAFLGSPMNFPSGYTGFRYYAVVLDNQVQIDGPGSEMTARYGIEVFDADTGELMAAGGLS